MLRRKIAYYGDFVAYPIAMATLVVLYKAPLIEHVVRALAVCASGLVVWTLLEYLLHRWALHSMPIFTSMHAAHHSAPLTLLGTPPWVSIPVWIVVILLPLSAVTGSEVAASATLGVMVGYWWYGIVHHFIHHPAHRRSLPYVNALRAWHLRHHHSPRRGNFGVTLPLWDYLFKTVINARPDNASTIRK
jgi:sterol desaturase/sphingolipid hydroxylase (fatty acid hydroxylase superfamily)